MYHIQISFGLLSKREDHVELTNKLAKTIADHIGKEHQLVYAVHENKENLHIHFAINAVNYMTGLKRHHKISELAEWQDEIRKIVWTVMNNHRREVDFSYFMNKCEVVCDDNFMEE